MITNAILEIILLPIKLIMGVFPRVDTIPLVDSSLVTGFGYFRVFAEFFPPFYTMLTLFGAWLVLKLILLVARFFLGNRVPTLS